MPSYTTADIRNIALFGHGGAGKTSLAEAMLHEAQVIGHVGSVERGTTVSDFTDEEKHGQHSLYCSPLGFDYQGKHLNLLDTPGYPDFIGHTLIALSAVETAAIVINAAAGIEPTARRMMDRAAERGLCRCIIVNKIDAQNIDLPQLLEQIREAFGTRCLPVNLPADGGKAVVDCFKNTSGDSDLGAVADAHLALVEQIVEANDPNKAVPEKLWVQLRGRNLVMGIHEDDDLNKFVFVASKDVGSKQAAVLVVPDDATAVEKVSKKTGKWVAMKIEKEGEKKVVKFTLKPADGELMRVVRPGKK